jgi:hypothetical protein
MLMMKKTKNLEFEPLHPKNVLLASVVHGISCLFFFIFSISKPILPSYLAGKKNIIYFHLKNLVISLTKNLLKSDGTENSSQITVLS